MTGTDKTGKAGSGGELHMQATTWPTPSAHGSAGEDSPDLERKGSKLVNRKTGRILQTNLATEVKHWPTATAKDADSAGNRSSPLCNPGTSLHEAATNWPTPRTLTGGGESAERKKELGREEAGGGDLQAAAETWPTPNQRDYKGSDLTTRRGGGELESLRREGGEDSLFPPGPRDFDAWGRVVEDGSADFRAPAIKPGLRLLVDGVALVVDESRRDQLRAAGNGVVPLQAAFALVVLARKAGLI